MFNVFLSLYYILYILISTAVARPTLDSLSPKSIPSPASRKLSLREKSHSLFKRDSTLYNLLVYDQCYNNRGQKVHTSDRLETIRHTVTSDQFTTYTTMVPVTVTDSDAASTADTSAPSSTVLPSSPTVLPSTGAKLGNGKSVAVYWGQNCGFFLLPFTKLLPTLIKVGRNNMGLDQVCALDQFDIVIISFIAAFGKGNTITMDLANHCSDTLSNSGYTGLLSCPDVGKAITSCQSKGKKVLISLGGADGAYGFDDDDTAKKFSLTMWKLFLGGTSSSRPFGAATLDGIDLDLEAGTSVGYAAFVNELRALMDTDSSRNYFITGTPQCPYPDASLGPGKATALSDAINAFSALFVQNYDNYCEFTQSSDKWTIDQWTSLGPQIFAGLPVASNAAGSGYVDPSKLKDTISPIKGKLSGIMFWDASFDDIAEMGSAAKAALM